MIPKPVVLRGHRIDGAIRAPVWLVLYQATDTARLALTPCRDWAHALRRAHRIARRQARDTHEVDALIQHAHRFTN